MKPKEGSKIEQIALTSCLEIKKRINLSIYFYSRVDPMVFSFNLNGYPLYVFMLQNKVGNK